MNVYTLRKTLFAVLCAGIASACADARAATGYVALLDGTPTIVKTGEAASYMRVGRDWSDGATNPSGTAKPTKLQVSTITSWSDNTALHFKFEIPDWTTKQADGSTLASGAGDKIIVQIDPDKSGGVRLGFGGTRLTNDHRFEVTIRDRKVVDPDEPGVTETNRPKSYIPYPDGSGWDTANPQSTEATVTLALASADPGDPLSSGRIYTVTLDIPRSELGNPTYDMGVAFALMNDLGHKVSQFAPNEYTGVAFPMTMAITPGSDPGLFQLNGTSSGAWIAPETWGIGYFSLATTSPDVTFRQDDSFYISKAIRLGKCSTFNWGDIGEVNLGNWTHQDQIPNWYLYNPPGANTDHPCPMAIWMDANVNFAQNAPGIVKKRFLVVWGRPGISPQDWYFAGLTEPVAITSPDTPVSFVWRDVPAVAFSDHPCLRAYILPENLTTQEIQEIQNIKSAAQLTTMENRYLVTQGSNKSAQMNFTNIGPVGNCDSANNCSVIGRLMYDTLFAPLMKPWLISNAAAAEIRSSRPAIPVVPGVKPEHVQVTDDGFDTNLVRITATAFGVAQPTGKRRYVYIEEIGGIGWAVPANQVGAAVTGLQFEVTNPKVAAKFFAREKAVEIPSPVRTVSIAIEADAKPGTRMPRFDVTGLEKNLRQPLKPGQTVSANIGVKPGTEICPPKCCPCKKPKKPSCKRHMHRDCDKEWDSWNNWEKRHDRCPAECCRCDKPDQPCNPFSKKPCKDDHDKGDDGDHDKDRGRDRDKDRR